MPWIFGNVVLIFPSFNPIVKLPFSHLTPCWFSEIIVPPVIVKFPLFRLCTVALSLELALKYASPEINVVPPLLYNACLVPVASILPPVISKFLVLFITALPPLDVIFPPTTFKYPLFSITGAVPFESI